jgi:hypothetical protein
MGVSGINTENQKRHQPQQFEGNLGRENKMNVTAQVKHAKSLPEPNGDFYKSPNL